MPDTIIKLSLIHIYIVLRLSNIIKVKSLEDLVIDHFRTCQLKGIYDCLKAVSYTHLETIVIQYRRQNLRHKASVISRYSHYIILYSITRFSFSPQTEGSFVMIHASC